MAKEIARRRPGATRQEKEVGVCEE